jgi:hypothetical protein
MNLQIDCYDMNSDPIDCYYISDIECLLKSYNYKRLMIYVGKP